MQIIEASRIGGKHCYEFVKRNLNQLLSNKLAQTYSWFGKKHKKKFYELKLAEMLIGKILILSKLIYKLNFLQSFCLDFDLFI